MSDKTNKLNIDLSFLDGDDDKFVWTCDYCDKEFETKIESDKHQEICEKRTPEITSPVEPEYIWTCDYCKKEFETKKDSDEHELVCELNKNKTKKSKTFLNSLYVWLITIVIFIVLAVLGSSYPSYPDWVTSWMLIDIGVGIIGFIIMVTSAMSSLSKKVKNFWWWVGIIVVVIVFLLMSSISG